MSAYRNYVWLKRGLRDYTKSGYETARQRFNSADMDVDCSGKSFVITGANSGIGKSVALSVAKRGGTLHLVCRNSRSAEEARQEIAATSGNENVYVHPLDLSQPEAVIKWGNKFLANEKKLDVLVNNAGCMIHTREIDAHGLEKNFSTNTFGTHLLTTSLIPLLCKSTRPRVVVVSSAGMLKQKLNVTDWQLEKEKVYNGTVVYAQNKRQQVVMTEQYAIRHPHIHFACMHPGWADTPAVRNSMPAFYKKMKDLLRTADQGADTATWLAISEAALAHPSGLFFEDRRPVSKHLPFAWTRSTQKEQAQFMEQLDSLMGKFLDQ